MKKILVMLLAAVMCVSFVACGGNDSPANNESAKAGNQDSDDSSANNGDAETEIDYAKIISEESGYWLSFYGYDMGLVFCEDNSYQNATTRDELGTWELKDTTLTLTSEDGNNTYYEIKDANGVCLLIGDNAILYNGTLDGSEFPIKEVEITIDNWQEYFEIATCTVENVDIFGEVTETSKCYLKLKDEYFKYLINSCGSLHSEIALRYGLSSSSTSDSYMDIWNDTSVFGEHWDETYELVKIQGTLYFIDIEE